MSECSAPARQSPAAAALRAADVDLVELGVRGEGPLAWTPASGLFDTGVADDASTRRRRRVLAVRRVHEHERRSRILVAAAAYWREVAA